MSRVSGGLKQYSVVSHEKLKLPMNFIYREGGGGQALGSLVTNHPPGPLSGRPIIARLHRSLANGLSGRSTYVLY